MSATVFAVLFGTSVALNVWLWFRSEHYREQASLSPERRMQEWILTEWPYQRYSSAIESVLAQREEKRARREGAGVFWDIESGTVQDGRFVTIANDDWKVKS